MQTAIEHLESFARQYQHFQTMDQDPKYAGTAGTMGAGFRMAAMEFCRFLEAAYPDECWTSLADPPKTLGDHIAKLRRCLGCTP